MRERQRDLLIPSHHQQVGEKERNSLKQQFDHDNCAASTPSHCDRGGLGKRGGEGWGGVGGRGLGAEVRRRRGGQQERATQQRG